jgi:hypothetical protein
MAIRRFRISRTQNLLFAALLMSSATAFAADAPDPSKGEEVLPPGQFEGGAPPSTPPPAAQLPPEESLPDAAPATSPGEENKGKPATTAQPKAGESNTNVPANIPGEENKGNPTVPPQ